MMFEGVILVAAAVFAVLVAVLVAVVELQAWRDAHHGAAAARRSAIGEVLRRHDIDGAEFRRRVWAEIEPPTRVAHPHPRAAVEQLDNAYRRAELRVIAKLANPLLGTIVDPKLIPFADCKHYCTQWDRARQVLVCRYCHKEITT